MGHGNGKCPLVRNTTNTIHLHFCGKLFPSTLDLRFLVSLQGPPLPLRRWHRNLDGRMIDSRGSPGLVDWDWELGWIPWMHSSKFARFFLTPSLSAWKTRSQERSMWLQQTFESAILLEQHLARISFLRFFVTLLMVGASIRLTTERVYENSVVWCTINSTRNSRQWHQTLTRKFESKFLVDTSKSSLRRSDLAQLLRCDQAENWSGTFVNSSIFEAPLTLPVDT